MQKLVSYVAIFFLLYFPIQVLGESVIRINQLGYLPNSSKTAVFLSDKKININKFLVYNSLSNEKVVEGIAVAANAEMWGKQSAYQLDFSALKIEGGYYIAAAGTTSPSFRIANDAYVGTADYILNYMRQQRCGFNPFFEDSCHVHDGIIVDHPTKSGEKIDVTGGWHDASDYLQYVCTSANATYQMLFAYKKNPEVYSDQYKANGLPGKNGIPDILDEARWGIEWLMKMNPAKNEMYNQIADDRDHRGYRLPTEDTVSYGLGKARPVYFVTGKPQGLGEHKNRSTGVASTAAKYASAFGLGAQVFRPIDANFAEKLSKKAKDAWEFALSDPGVCQTACTVSPYFYEEDNYVDDMELAAATLFNSFSNNETYQQQANYWGTLEPVTPWMELHRARHYQYYPFINLGHFWLANSTDPAIAKKYQLLMKQGLESIKKHAADDPFRIGIPLVWCSNNFVVAAATQARLYRELTGDKSFEKMEAALIDWLWGCNPWGTSMICGAPKGGDNPQNPHSSITRIMHKTTLGGLVDGPVYRSIYESLRGIELTQIDEYANYQNGKAVYHDDIGDYSSNEPTMDGTASLSYNLSSLEKEGLILDKNQKNCVKDNTGAIIRMDTLKANIFLLFSAHDFNDGGKKIASILKKKNVKASFFFTGYFYQNPSNKQLIQNLLEDGHYLGAHSDKHLLYADWNKRDSLLVTRRDFELDLQANYHKMKLAGINIASAKYFLPPYEWHNPTIADWTSQLGLKLINITPGIRTNADYTTPEMKNYKSTDWIIKQLKSQVEKVPNKLNGSLLLIHLGTSNKRTDKLYDRLEELIDYLEYNGYKFMRL